MESSKFSRLVIVSASTTLLVLIALSQGAIPQFNDPIKLNRRLRPAPIESPATLSQSPVATSPAAVRKIAESMRIKPSQTRFEKVFLTPRYPFRPQAQINAQGSIHMRTTPSKDYIQLGITGFSKVYATINAPAAGDDYLVVFHIDVTSPSTIVDVEDHEPITYQKGQYQVSVVQHAEREGEQWISIGPNDRARWGFSVRAVEVHLLNPRPAP